MPGRVAIVGMGLRAPGGPSDPDAYWAALADGRVLIGDLPEDRRGGFGSEWDEVVTRAGYVRDVFDFDRRFFGMSPRESRVVDPQHRMLLEVTWEAFEDAGIVPSSVAESAGVVVGITGQDYRHWLPDSPNAYMTTGNGHSFSAGRVAHAFGLRGATMAVDTACSSSLVAVDTACRLLTTGMCDTVVAGGVNLILSPRTTREVGQTGALSPDGRSRPFDAAANGFVRAEGCGMLVLKRLDDAVRNRDPIRAVVEATGVNQDGDTATFTAPNGRAQADLVRAVLASAAIDPAEVFYHEAHGTSTPLGDPVEMASILDAFRHTPGGSPLYVGSVKGNIGHAESAAGVLALIKAVLCLERGAVPPQPMFESINPRIDLVASGITIPTVLTDSGFDASPYASVSSYGMSGTNAFAVLSRSPTVKADASIPSPYGFVVSAHEEDALRAVAARYRAYLGRIRRDDYPLFAATVNHGRTVLSCARLVEAKDPDTAIEVLAALETGGPDPRALPVHGRETVAAPRSARRMVPPLPTYPWQRQTYVATPSERAS